MNIRIATWNIAGAHRLISDKRMDYGPQDIDYFAEQIRKLDLDIVCLQESQTKRGDSLTEKLAAATTMPHWAETEGCPSHVDRDYKLTTAILSKIPFRQTDAVLLPHPSFELRFTHNNTVVMPYDRYLVTAAFDDFTVATLHTEPLGAFGLDYAQGEGNTLAKLIDKVLVDELAEPLLLAGDFNTNDLPSSFPNATSNYRLREVFAKTPTRPDGERTDHVAYSPQWLPQDSGIIHSQTDHYLCWAEFKLAQGTC